MAKVQIKLAAADEMFNVMTASNPVQLAMNMLQRNAYTILPAMQSEAEGEAAAEDVFDLTNNPDRQDERLATYGNGRSVSTGDIVCVDGVDYLCCSIGWKRLS